MGEEERLDGVAVGYHFLFVLVEVEGFEGVQQHKSVVLEGVVEDLIASVDDLLQTVDEVPSDKPLPEFLFDPFVGEHEWHSHIREDEIHQFLLVHDSLVSALPPERSEVFGCDSLIVDALALDLLFDEELVAVVDSCQLLE